MELITAKYVLPMDSEAVSDGAIVTELGKIKAVGKATELKEAFRDATVEENSHSVLMPGLVNTHTHLDLTGALDMARGNPASGSMDYIDWLVNILNYRKKSSITQTTSQIQNALNSLISSGTTCVGDMTCFEGIFKMIDDAGLRAIVYPEIYASAGDVAQDRFESALALAEKYTEERLDLVKVGLAPFAPYLLSRNLLTIISQHAKHMGVPVQIHAAESFTEMEFFYDSKGSIATTLFPSIGWGENELPPPHHKTPIQYLGEIGFLETSPAIVGGLHLGFRDFTTIARNMCRVIYCPRTNHYLGHGNFPFGKLREHGIPIGIGTDTLNGPTGFNLWDEMRFVKETSITPSPTPRDLLQMATIGGARVLSLEHEIGSLTLGKSADYIILDLPECPAPSLVYDAVLRNTRPANVKRVVVAGEILKTC